MSLRVPGNPHFSPSNLAALGKPVVVCLVVAANALFPLAWSQASAVGKRDGTPHGMCFGSPFQEPCVEQTRDPLRRVPVGQRFFFDYVSVTPSRS